MVPVLVFILLGALSQTIYPERQYFKLHVANDGLIQALIDANEEYWMTAYRQFIELDTDAGELMIAFNVGYSEYPTIEAMKSNAHIMTSTIQKGGYTFSEPTNVTENAEGYIDGNMVLWYDTMKKQMVMVYQSSRTTKTTEDGFDVKLNLIRKDSGDDEWSEEQEILSDIDSPHVRYQFIESSTTNTEGYSNNLIIPIHKIAASDADGNFEATDNFQQIVIMSRTLDADASFVISNMEDHVGLGAGYFQASIVRVPSEDNSIGSQLVAFLSDAEGYWTYRSTSEDDGYTWTSPAMTAIPNPDQTSQAIYLHNGLLMLIYNPSQSMTTEPSAGDAYANCHHLAVGMSSDYGLTWQFSRMLEYAYDGMFNNPVGLQDPMCNNIYLTYSVMTDETNGCSMLDECTLKSQGTASYIKFTVITEQWVMNDFNYKYDYDNCAWKIPEQLLMSGIASPVAATFDTVIASSSELSTVIILSIAVGSVALLNIGLCYWTWVRKREYTDLELSQIGNDPNDYETTK